ncbi:hypothetical protein ACHAXR_008453 [Thalassiosira sp. AJA248-18]
MDPNSLAIEFMCPVCQVLPGDPVLAEDGFVYCKLCTETFIFDDSKDIISPMTGEGMGRNLVHSGTVKDTIRILSACEELDDRILRATEKQVKSIVDEISDIKQKAKQGSVDHMVIAAGWYLFGEKDGVERDSNKGYYWCKKAAEMDNMTGKSYLGYCLICGLGIERPDWEDGYELLIEAANQNADATGRGDCYERGIYGFRNDVKKAEKWSRRAKSKPSYIVFDCDIQEIKIDARAQLEMDHCSGGVSIAGESLSGDGILWGNEYSGSNEHGGLWGNTVERESFEVDQCSLSSQYTATTSSTSRFSAFTRHSTQSEVSTMAANISHDSNFRSVTSGRKCALCSKTIIDSPSELCLKCRAPGCK